MHFHVLVSCNAVIKFWVTSCPDLNSCICLLHCVWIMSKTGTFTCIIKALHVSIILMCNRCYKAMAMRSTCGHWCFDVRMCQDSMCFCPQGIVAGLHWFSIFLCTRNLLRGYFPSCPSLSFISVTGPCFSPLRKGLVAGLPGLASHGSSHPPWIWLPIIVAPGCLRYPMSTLPGSC